MIQDIGSMQVSHLSWMAGSLVGIPVCIAFILVDVWQNVQGWNPAAGSEGTNVVEMPEHKTWSFGNRPSLRFLHIAACPKANRLSFWEPCSSWRVLQPSPRPADPRQNWMRWDFAISGRQKLPAHAGAQPKEGFVCICTEKISARQYSRHSAGKAEDQML